MGKNRQYFRSAARLCVLIFAAFSPHMGLVSASAGDAHSQHAKVELLAAKDAVAPGENASIGLHFVLEPGWHIYWQNPGDSGEPPRIQFQLPAGFHAGQIEWPAPQRLGSATVVDFGYSGEVLLIIPLAIPQNAVPGTHEDLAATAKWLVCREICIPDQAQLGLTLNIAAWASSAGSAMQTLFARFRKLIPAAVPSNWNVKAISEGGGDLILSVETGKPEEHALFYPFLPDPIENSAPQPATHLAKGVQLKLHKSDQQVEPVAILKGVLVLGDPQGSAGGSGGSSSAYRIAVPVRQSRKR
jgi:DsbC/DsbD-like thiol-disulfide interchange protein